MDNNMAIPGQILMAQGLPIRFIVWAGVAHNHLMVILSDGATFRLDKDEAGVRYWTELEKIPVDFYPDKKDGL